MLSGTFRPNGVARAVAGGYQVSGQWPLASGSSHATWLLGGCRIVDGDQPRLTPAGRPELRLVFLPVGDAAILDTWHAAGLRGTASHDFVLRDCFIPAHRTCWFTHAPARPEPLYRLPAIAVFAAWIAAVPLGIARHAIAAVYGPRGGEDADLVAGPPARESRGPAGRGPGRGVGPRGAGVPDRDAARRLGDGDRWGRLVVGATRLAQAGQHAGGDPGCPGRRAALYGGRASAVYTSTGLERCLRDVRTAAQHITVTPTNFEIAGQLALGLDVHQSVWSIDDRGMGSAPRCAPDWRGAAETRDQRGAPSPALHLTAYSVRSCVASAFGSGSYLALRRCASQPPVPSAVHGGARDVRTSRPADVRGAHISGVLTSP